MARLTKLTGTLHPADHPSYVKMILPAIDLMIYQCYTSGKAQLTHVLQLFRSISTEMSAKPLRFIADSSVWNYALVWKHFVLYLLRASAGDLDPDLQLTPEQLSCLARLRHISTMVEKGETIVPLLKELTTLVIRQPITNNI